MRPGPVSISVLLSIGVLAFPATSHAQESGFGYAFAGATTGIDDRPLTMTAGAGGEVITGWKGTTIGLEAAGLWLPALETDGGFRRSITVGAISLNMSRHFPQPSGFGRWRPFLTGGVLIVTSGDAAQGGFMIGGGVDRWFTRHAGLRIDVRDQFLPGSFSLVGVRAGFIFR